MIDVIRLQKVNELAKALKMQGIVSTHEEASSLATELAGSKEDDLVFRGMHVDDNSQLVVMQEHQQNQQMEGAVPTKVVSTADYYTKAEVEQVLQKLADQVCSEVNKWSEQLEQHAKNITFLHKTIEDLKKGAVIARADETPQTRLNVPNVVQESVVQQPAASTPSARTGSFNSNDVAIDKFFYFGNGAKK